MSIDKLPTRLGQPPQLDPRILRMDSFQDEGKETSANAPMASDHYEPFFMDKGLFDLEMDPFNFELDDLDLAGYDNENQVPMLNVNASVVDMNQGPLDGMSQIAGILPPTGPQMNYNYTNYDWEAIAQKKELGQIAPLPITFDEDMTQKDDKETQRRIPLAPRQTIQENQLNIQQAIFNTPKQFVKVEPTIKTEPLTCRVTISSKPFTPAAVQESVALSPSGVQRKICLQAGCTNRARSHQRCKKHGGARQCTFEGCLKNSQSRGLCIAHGGGSRCRFEGCKRASQSRGLCKSHGGGKFCAVSGCKKKAHLKQLCRMHGGGERCKVGKCEKWAQKKGWCMAHAKELEH